MHDSDDHNLGLTGHIHNAIRKPLDAANASYAACWRAAMGPLVQTIERGIDGSPETQAKFGAD